MTRALRNSDCSFHPPALGSSGLLACWPAGPQPLHLSDLQTSIPTHASRSVQATFAAAAPPPTRWQAVRECDETEEVWRRRPVPAGTSLALRYSTGLIAPAGVQRRSSCFDFVFACCRPQGDREKTRGTEVRSTNSPWRARWSIRLGEVFFFFSFCSSSRCFLESPSAPASSTGDPGPSHRCLAARASATGDVGADVRHTSAISATTCAHCFHHRAAGWPLQ